MSSILSPSAVRRPDLGNDRSPYFRPVLTTIAVGKRSFRLLFVRRGRPKPARSGPQVQFRRVAIKTFQSELSRPRLAIARDRPPAREKGPGRAATLVQADLPLSERPSRGYGREKLSVSRGVWARVGRNCRVNNGAVREHRIVALQSADRLRPGLLRRAWLGGV